MVMTAVTDRPARGSNRDAARVPLIAAAIAEFGQFVDNLIKGGENLIVVVVIVVG